MLQRLDEQAGKLIDKYKSYTRKVSSRLLVLEEAGEEHCHHESEARLVARRRR